MQAEPGTGRCPRRGRDGLDAREQIGLGIVARGQVEPGVLADDGRQVLDFATPLADTPGDPGRATALDAEAQAVKARVAQEAAAEADDLPVAGSAAS